MTMKFVITPQGANIWADGKVFTVPSSHPRWAILSLAFKDKNEALAAWVLNDSVKTLGAAATESDARFTPEGSWLNWQASDDELPELLPASWKAAVDSWVAAGYDLVPLARFMARTTAAQRELAGLAIGHPPVFDWLGNIQVKAEPLPNGHLRLGRGSVTWIDPTTLTAPRGYVEGCAAVNAPSETHSLVAPGRVFDKRAAATFALESWTGKQWVVAYSGDSLIQALDQLDAEQQKASKVRVRATLDGVTATAWAATNPQFGFQVTHQPEGKAEVALATVYILPDAQAIARHIRAPGQLRIKRNGEVVAERAIY